MPWLLIQLDPESEWLSNSNTFFQSKTLGLNIRYELLIQIDNVLI